MGQDDASYHRQRAATQRALAASSDDPATSHLHYELARLHDDKVRAAVSRPVLRMVMPR